MTIPQVSRLGVLFIQCNASQLAINSILKLYIYTAIYCVILLVVVLDISRLYIESIFVHGFCDPLRVKFGLKCPSSKIIDKFPQKHAKTMIKHNIRG